MNATGNYLWSVGAFVRELTADVKYLAVVQVCLRPPSGIFVILELMMGSVGFELLYVGERRSWVARRECCYRNGRSISISLYQLSHWDLFNHVEQRCPLRYTRNHPHPSENEASNSIQIKRTILRTIFDARMQVVRHLRLCASSNGGQPHL
jgi:hypothetical protein